MKQCEICNTFYISRSQKSRFCSRKCMYIWRKSIHWETAVCIGCQIKFVRRINEKHWRTGIPQQYCSAKCSRSSEHKKKQLRHWANSTSNHWNKPNIQFKVKQTKHKLYGDANYNNSLKNKETCMKKYGVPYAIVVAPKSNGKRISNIQRKVYNNIRTTYPDALLEYWLSDVEKSVDIFIPSQNKIVEVYGTYWHCNPSKYAKDYYNKSIKMTAEQIWNRDARREQLLRQAGYNLEIVWE